MQSHVYPELCLLRDSKSSCIDVKAKARNYSGHTAADTLSSMPHSCFKRTGFGDSNSQDNREMTTNALLWLCSSHFLKKKFSSLSQETWTLSSVGLSLENHKWWIHIKGQMFPSSPVTQESKSAWPQHTVWATHQLCGIGPSLCLWNL